VEAVLAHELGHFKHRHVLKRIVLLFGISLAGLALLGWLAQQPASTPAWACAQPAAGPGGRAQRRAGAAAVHAGAAGVHLLRVAADGGPVAPARVRGRRLRLRAGQRRDLANALLKLHEDNASTLTPDPLYVRFYYSHPPASERAGERVICHPRGKKLAVVVGDGVRWRPSHDEGTVEQITPRRNLLYRQDAVRTKSFAANLDQVLILVAAEPEFSEHQLARALIACEAEHIEPLIALNKADLAEPFARAWQRLAPYRAMGYAVLPLAVKPRGPAPAQADTLATRSASACTGAPR
jgi:hypothetical protein